MKTKERCACSRHVDIDKIEHGTVSPVDDLNGRQSEKQSEIEVRSYECGGELFD
jgi:hypothetical protein